MSRVLISTCIITQNNLVSLQRAIASAAVFSDEIVVVDGGSTDGTEFFVRAHPKCRYFCRTFDGNFGRQKNFAFDQASGAWIVELDDDEAICDELGGRLRALLDGAAGMGFALRRWWVRSLDPLRYVSTELFETTWIPRVFRNRPELRYVFSPDSANSGVIHHEFSREMQAQIAPVSQWRILHFHYMLRSRAERERRFAWFYTVDPQCVEMNARCYLYEDYSHRVLPCPAHWTSTALQPQPPL